MRTLRVIYTSRENIFNKDSSKIFIMNDYTQADNEVVVLEDDSDDTSNQVQQKENLSRTTDFRKESADDSYISVISEIINSNHIKRPATGDVNSCETNCERQDRFHLVTSSIDGGEDLKSVRAFAGLFNGTFSGKNSLVTKDTTHLIMKPVHSNKVCRTFKYLKAIVLHKPVVSLDWIQMSVLYGCPLPVEEFLVHGEHEENAVELSLKDAKNHLFQNISVLLIGSVFNGLNSKNIEELLVAGGARVFKNKELFKIMPRLSYKVVLLDTKITGNMCRENCKRYSALTLPASWVIDSVTQYRLTPWQPYLPQVARKVILYEFCVLKEPLYISSDEEDERKPLIANFSTGCSCTEMA